MIGFKLNELMTGTHRLSDDPEGGERPLTFALTWGNSSLLQWANPFSDRFLWNEARGWITVDGLVEKADCKGSLHLLYFSGRKIRYDLVFNDEQGRAYRYVGEKRNIWPWNLHRTHVTCYGTVTELETGKVISESIVYFPWRQGLTFLFSFRFTMGNLFQYT
ncbi:hypothetical protein [Desulfosudis oleivorans]|uniref:Uncharacterized protein n=1 Tax=Desulfosudis oleivorans (strain DSM 6200 / JCM 39069 / Hxd3) TaxID=96561 RepID=A8ZWJ4_DESOH|nr:hypothetical protein [Desulfosudis oleivorans]ABW66802.1 hypothetical protein Dole_0992 [Desulfosudis oleivorans Hxd3]